MDRGRGRSGEAGWTLVELLMVMAISLVIGAAALMAIETGRDGSAKTAARQEAVQEAETALAQMTRETRQAVGVRLWSATFLDLKTRVRSGGGTELRRVQYDCDGERECIRRDCGPVAAGVTLAQLGRACEGRSASVVRGLDALTFSAERAGAAVAPPRETDNDLKAFDFVGVAMRIRLDDFESGRQAVAKLDPVTIEGGVRLENVITP